MTDRRRTNRFVIPDYSHGTFRVMQDVYIERVDTDHVTVLSDHPLRTGEELMLELPAALGIRAILTVAVTSCVRVRTGDKGTPSPASRPTTGAQDEPGSSGVSG